MKEQLKLGITIGAVVVATLGLLVWIYTQMAYVGRSPFKGPDSIAAQIDKCDEQIGAAKDKIDQIPDRQEELAKLEPVARSASQLLPRETTVYELLEAMRAKAKEANVDPRSIRPKELRGGGAAAGEFEEISFDLEIEGNYDDIVTFINKMEEFEIIREKDDRKLGKKAGDREERFFAIKEFELKAKNEGVHPAGLLNCRMALQTFRYTGVDEEEQK